MSRWNEGEQKTQKVPDRSLHQHPSNQVHLVHDATENVLKRSET